MLKNVVVVYDFAEVNGGGAKVAVNTVIELSKLGLNVYFFAGVGEPDKSLAGLPNVTAISLRGNDIFHDKNRIRAMFNGIYNFKAGKIFREFLSTLDKNETVVHIHSFSKYFSSSIFTATRELGFKTFLTMHDYFITCPNGGCLNFQTGKICEIQPMSLKCILCNCDSRHYYHKIWRVIRQCVQNRVIKKSADNGLGFIFISEFSRHQILRRTGDIANKFLVRNPIYFVKRFRIEVEKNNLFTYIGRFSTEKGILQFCEAIHDTGTKGVAIGDGYLRDELESKYPEIIFTGWLDMEQIFQWLMKTRCIVFPSLWYEVAPAVPLEVNAYGISVISSDCNAASDDAAFVYHSQTELEDMIRRVNSQDIRQLSEDIYNSFDDTVTTNYADNLMKIYSSQLTQEEDSCNP